MDSVVSVERHSERVLILRMVLDSGLLNVLMVYVQRNKEQQTAVGRDRQRLDARVNPLLRVCVY